MKSTPNPNRVSFNFTFYAGPKFFRNDIRTKKGGDFMGCIGNLGWYCVRMGLLVFSGADATGLIGLVKEVQVVRYRLNDEGVPIDADCIVHCSDVSDVFLILILQFASRGCTQLLNNIGITIPSGPGTIISLQLPTCTESNCYPIWDRL